MEAFDDASAAARGTLQPLFTLEDWTNGYRLWHAPVFLRADVEGPRGGHRGDGDGWDCPGDIDCSGFFREVELEVGKL